MAKDLVAYCRVSTKQQGASGLGMETQRAAVESYARQARAGAKAAAEAHAKAATEAYADLAPILAELRGKGLSLQAIANELNRQGHTTRRGRPWNRVQVARVLERTL